jgi:bifunctional UDP-N-acetylglucosamine pyrophosphorylase / glucosamine-1-phosphate N-acetyltransferase
MSIHPTAIIDPTVHVEEGAIIEAFVVLRGNTFVASSSRVDVGCVLTDTTVGPNAYVKPHCVCSEAVIGPGVQVGPMAHLRPGTVLEKSARVGNFVEIVRSTLREGAMANHLAFIGDAEVGERSNISAGVIFCNSDGVNKFRATVGNDAFIGTDSQLIAPVLVGDGAFVATGTTITKDVPPNAMAISRGRQENREGYAEVIREKRDAKGTVK